MHYEIKPLTPHGITKIIDWNEGTDERFLVQWTGVGFTYPLTAQQLRATIDSGATVFEIVHQEQMIATIRIMNINEEMKEGFIGCYLLAPALRGQGHGRAIMRAFAEYAFQSLSLQSLKLKVLAGNIGAIKCYEKVGYQITQELSLKNGIVYIMVLEKADFVMED